MESSIDSLQQMRLIGAFETPIQDGLDGEYVEVTPLGISHVHMGLRDMIMTAHIRYVFRSGINALVVCTEQHRIPKSLVNVKNNREGWMTATYMNDKMSVRPTSIGNIEWHRPLYPGAGPRSGIPNFDPCLALLKATLGTIPSRVTDILNAESVVLRRRKENREWTVGRHVFDSSVDNEPMICAVLRDKARIWKVKS